MKPNSISSLVVYKPVFSDFLWAGTWVATLLGSDLTISSIVILLTGNLGCPCKVNWINK